MNKHPYRDAMDRLSFSSDLEAKTIAMLEAASAATTKEEPAMTKPNNIFNKPKRSFGSLAKRLALGGGSLAVAACLLLALLPGLQGTPADLPMPPVLSTSMPISAGGAAPQMEMEMDALSAFAPPPAANEALSRQSLGMVSGSPAMLFAAAPTAWNTEEYSYFSENRFLSTLSSPMSTFAADVDTASYAKLRSALLAGREVPIDSVRIEEMLNYFSYQYAEPKNGEPFGVTAEIADCPWNPDTKLLLIGLQAQKINVENLPAQNLVFLIDVSGSMMDANKLPLVKRSLKLLLEELKPTDTLSIVTYASNDTIVLDGVRASDKVTIMEALDSLEAGGGTAGAQGIQTAYELASKHFISGGSNRILLATDGDLNIGISDEGSLTRLVAEKRETGIYLSVLGYGMGNYKDNKLEALADHGNGNYAYIDTIYEARKALVEEIGATFLTVAKDVKLQVEFNPAKLKGYRLVGYENRLLAAEDFSDDTKDGGEVGSGHQITVLYELVPADSAMDIHAPESKYQSPASTGSDEWLTLSLRCKAPDGDESQLFSYIVAEMATQAPSDNLRFASAVAEAGMLLRNSEHKANASYASILQRLRESASVTGDPYKEEFQYLVSLLARQEELPKK